MRDDMPKGFPKKAKEILDILIQFPNGVSLIEIAQKANIKSKQLVCYYLYGFQHAKKNQFFGGYLKDVLDRIIGEGNIITIKLKPDYATILKSKLDFPKNLNGELNTPVSLNSNNNIDEGKKA